MHRTWSPSFSPSLSCSSRTMKLCREWAIWRPWMSTWVSDLWSPILDFWPLILDPRPPIFNLKIFAGTCFCIVFCALIKLAFVKYMRQNVSKAKWEITLKYDCSCPSNGHIIFITYVSLRIFSPKPPNGFLPFTTIQIDSGKSGLPRPRSLGWALLSVVSKIVTIVSNTDYVDERTCGMRRGEFFTLTYI